ncbi:MAG: hypothetical protein IKC27_09000 [Kiritimatiellae bacterium]|nr:hypothetical protein [Kiritimatiellia bacterium]
MDNLSNEKSHEKAMAAHERFMARKKAYVMRNPSAVPVREREMLLGDIQREGLRKHEMDMLDKRNVGNLDVARENRGAAREQGVEAANAKARADLELGKINKGLRETELQNQLTMHERTMVNNLAVVAGKGAFDKEIETIRANAANRRLEFEATEAEKKRKADLELENVRVRGGVAKARIEAQGRVDSARARGAEMEIRRANNALTTYLNNSVNKAAWEKMSEEEKKAWFDKRGLVDPREDAE